MDADALVFVVDDDASLRASLQDLLESVGLRVVACASAQEFLRRPRPEGPSCLVLDVRLPGLSGLELQRQLAAGDLTVSPSPTSSESRISSASSPQSRSHLAQSSIDGRSRRRYRMLIADGYVRPRQGTRSNVNRLTASWHPYVKHYAPNPRFDYGGRAAALWLDR